MDSSHLLFPNAPLESLETVQSGFVQRNGRALKFPRDIIPFAAITENSPEAIAELHDLLEPGESTYLVSYEPLRSHPDLQVLGSQGVQQFEWPADAPIPDAAKPAIEPLHCSHAAEMVALTDAAFPGFFRPRTCELGPYFGIRDGGQLIAMCGERMNIRKHGEIYRELSGLCTLPAYRGRGYAALLMSHLLREHRAQGHRSYLHVSSHNTNAIALYERMGFLCRGEFPIFLIQRQAKEPGE